jgi:uncharacterized membrane protein
MAGDEDPVDDEERWRRQHGNRLAGTDFGRILALSDGVFAFAMTLLVISLIVPGAPGSSISPPGNSGQLARDLLDDYTAIFGFVFAFVMIAIWWIIHNREFQYITRYDSPLVWMNMMILVQISLMPFVMGVYNTYTSNNHDYQSAVDLFAGIQITLGLSNLALWEYAKHAGLLRKDIPSDVSEHFTQRGLFTAAVFAISIGISFWSVEFAQFAWFGIVLAQRFTVSRHRLRERPRADSVE